jgi:hypothetical protein
MDAPREELVAEAVDCLEVASAASEGVLPALEKVFRRCKALGLTDVRLEEVIAAWRETIG